MWPDQRDSSLGAPSLAANLNLLIGGKVRRVHFVEVDGARLVLNHQPAGFRVIVGGRTGYADLRPGRQIASAQVGYADPPVRTDMRMRARPKPDKKRPH